MAGYALIDSHLEKVRAGLAHRADVAEVIAELEDHLYSAAERAEADGAEVRAAQEATLARFGDPGVVATAFATNARGGVAVPTSFTRSAGSVALVGAFLWLTFPAMWWIARASRPSSSGARGPRLPSPGPSSVPSRSAHPTSGATTGSPTGSGSRSAP